MISLYACADACLISAYRIFIMTSSTVRIFAIAALLVFFGNFVYTQAARPAGTPPENNVPAPIHVGGQTQDKVGSLSLGGGLLAGGVIVNGGSDFILGIYDGRTQGSKTANRALVHANVATGNDSLVINYNGDFEGGVVVQGPKLTAPQYCINTSCITSWPQQQTLQTVTTAGNTTTNFVSFNRNGAIGNADNFPNTYDIGAGRIAAGDSIYSYGRICAGNSSGDCRGSGGIVLNSNGRIDTNASGYHSSGGRGLICGASGTQCLNFTNQGWIYMSDTNGSIYGGQGMAMERVWVQGRAYVLGDICLGDYTKSANCISSWSQAGSQASTPTLQQVTQAGNSTIGGISLGGSLSARGASIDGVVVSGPSSFINTVKSVNGGPLPGSGVYTSRNMYAAGNVRADGGFCIGGSCISSWPVDTNTDTQDLSISGHTISLTNGGSVTVPDNDTKYSAGFGMSLSGTTFSSQAKVNCPPMLVPIRDASSGEDEYARYDQCYVVGGDSVVLRIVNGLDGGTVFNFRSDTATADSICRHYGFASGVVYTNGASNGSSLRYASGLTFGTTGTGTTLQDVRCYFGNVNN